jgi:tRNA A37 threonylcarbamoyladenosine synthetase subunit TsaC/SUA5/YrdC
MLFLLATDTCYGLAGYFTQEDYESIYDLKGRSSTKQLAFLVEDFDDMKKYVLISDEQITFLKKYPYPWSFLWVRHPEFQLPEWMDASKYEKISLRVAKVCLRHREWNEVERGDPGFQNSGLLGPSQWLEQLGFPLFLTSANLSWEKESTTLEEAQKYFLWLDGVDGWVCDRLPSDIFSLSDDGEIMYLRRNY